METLAFAATTYGYLWACSLPEALRHLGADGFTATEMMAAAPHLSPLLATAPELRQIRSAAAEAGVRLLSLNPPGQDLNLASPDESIRQFAVATYQRLIEHCEALEAPIAVVVPGKRHPLYPSPWEAAADPARRSVAALARHARGRGVRLAIENVPSHFLDRAALLSAFVGEFDPVEVGVALDVANAFMVEDPVDAIGQLASRTLIVHLSDTTRERWAHNPIGSGRIDWRPVLKALGSDLPGIPSVLEIIAPDAGPQLRHSRTALQQIAAGSEGAS